MSFPTVWRRAFTALLLSLAFFSALAEEMLQLGSMTYARAEAPHLRMPVTRKASFFFKVGGVAFEAVANGADGAVVTDLRYDRTAPDGERLLVTLRRGDSTITARGTLFDWELIPIARFALDENGSAMTLFGQLKDKGEEKKILDAGQRVINYHPALDNTLLGQRLFQADILILRSDAVHVFRDRRGTLLGAGEKSHDPVRNLKGFEEVQVWLEEQHKKGLTFQSYVVGDLGQRVVFNASAGKLTFTGRPHWATWRSQELVGERKARAEQVDDVLVPEYNRQVNAMNAAIDLATKREATMTQQEMDAALADLKQRRGKLAMLRKRIDAERSALQAVEEMPQFSTELSQKIESVGGINPLVYRAVKNTMHYRALFKHFQKRSPSGLTAFVKSLDGVAFEPKVVTPTVQFGG